MDACDQSQAFLMIKDLDVQNLPLLGFSNVRVGTSLVCVRYACLH
jgi:hypothetical protein